VHAVEEIIRRGVAYMKAQEEGNPVDPTFDHKQRCLHDVILWHELEPIATKFFKRTKFDFAIDLDYNPYRCQYEFNYPEGVAVHE